MTVTQTEKNSNHRLPRKYYKNREKQQFATINLWKFKPEGINEKNPQVGRRATSHST